LGLPDLALPGASLPPARALVVVANSFQPRMAGAEARLASRGLKTKVVLGSLAG